MSKTYHYKGSEYTVKENNLKQLRILQPLKKELARLSSYITNLRLEITQKEEMK